MNGCATTSNGQLDRKANCDKHQRKAIALNRDPRIRGEAGKRIPSGRTNKEVARMPRLAAGKQRSRPGSLPARKRRPRLSPVGYLANPASLTGIPKLNSHHSGTRITFGDAKLTSLAQTPGRDRPSERIRLDRGSESPFCAGGPRNSPVPPRTRARTHRRALRAVPRVWRRASSAPHTPNRSRPPMVSSCSCLTPNHRSRSALGQPSTNWNGINPVSAQRSTTVCAKPFIAGYGSMTIGTPATGSNR